MTCKMNVVVRENSSSDVVSVDVAMQRQRRRRLESSDAENRRFEARCKRTRVDGRLANWSSSSAEDSWVDPPEVAAVTASNCSNEKLQIETEFKILQSIIPGVAKEENVTELEIIDACVDYIEQLQHQLYLRYNPSRQQQQQQQQQQLRHWVRGTDGPGSLAHQVTRQHRQLANLRQNFRLR